MIVEVDVVAPQVVDLRDAAARYAAGINFEDSTALWQQVVADGGVPTS